MQTEVYGGMTAASATVGAKIGKKDETWKKKKVGKKAEKRHKTEKAPYNLHEWATATR